MKPAIIVHGGAWAIPDSLLHPSLEGVKRAALVGKSVLDKGGSSLDAVEAAVKVLEDDPSFDAGTGSVLTSEGTIEMDAMIMDGENLGSGAVASIQDHLHPIQIARLVMEKTSHILLVGKGANDFAEEQGIQTVPTESLLTSEAYEEFKKYKQYNKTVKILFSDRQKEGHETVGCVALDVNGHLAVGTSTGGITAKRPGRTGDSPLIGCGGYADDNSAAVSATGHGESLAKVCFSKSVVDKCSAGLNPKKSLEETLEYMTKRVGGAGGGICISKHGEVAVAFNTKRMAWAYINSKNDSCYGIEPCQAMKF